MRWCLAGLIGTSTKMLMKMFTHFPNNKRRKATAFHPVEEKTNKKLDDISISIWFLLLADGTYLLSTAPSQKNKPRRRPSDELLKRRLAPASGELRSPSSIYLLFFNILFICRQVRAQMKQLIEPHPSII